MRISIREPIKFNARRERVKKVNSEEILESGIVKDDKIGCVLAGLIYEQIHASDLLHGFTWVYWGLSMSLCRDGLKCVSLVPNRDTPQAQDQYSKI